MKIENSENGFLCVIPARGGSKGIPKKNLNSIGDLSILANTILQAKESKVFDYIHVSTDSIDIQKEAIKYGASCEFLRPAKYANDTIGTKESIKSSIYSLQNIGKRFKYVFELQPTYVFRKIKTIHAIKNIIENFDSAVTVKQIRDTSHPDYIFSSKEDFLVHGKKLPDKFNRQELIPKFAVVGIVLASKVEIMLNKDSIYESNCGFYEIDSSIELLDINEQEDLLICQEVYKRLNASL